MTQVKLWQIVSQTANAIIFSDADGNLKSLAAGGDQKILVSGPDGAPMWADNSALVSALQAQTDAANALATAKAYTEAQIAALVDNAPVALNTLNELAQKLNGEDSAINALLLQVDGKADKTEVAAHIAQAKQDTLTDSKAYTDSAVNSIVAGFTGQLSTTKGDILTQAASDASFKAATAKTEAVQDANAYTVQRIADAAINASLDATTKADSARTSAVNEAAAYTDSKVSDAVTSVTQAAQGMADAAQNAAAADASSKVDSLRDAIPGTFWVEGTSTACFLASSRNLDRDKATKDGLMVTEDFTEVTGAQVVANDSSLNAKLLFVNGVAQSEEWAAKKVGNGQLLITLSERLAEHIFDGTENAVMLLAEYRSYNPISRIS